KRCSTATWTRSSPPVSSRACSVRYHPSVRRPAPAGHHTPCAPSGAGHRQPQARRKPHDMSAPHTDTAVPDENRLIAERRATLERLREAGPAYPNDFRPDTHAAILHAECGALDEDALQALGREVRVAGRMMLKRVMGKASFATLQDGSGRIQLYLDRGVLGDETYAGFKSWDIGDIIGAEGRVFKTRKGELSIHVTALRLLAK